MASVKFSGFNRFGVAPSSVMVSTAKPVVVNFGATIGNTGIGGGLSTGSVVSRLAENLSRLIKLQPLPINTGVGIVKAGDKSTLVATKAAIALTKADAIRFQKSSQEVKNGSLDGTVSEGGMGKLVVGGLIVYVLYRQFFSGKKLF